MEISLLTFSRSLYLSRILHASIPTYMLKVSYFLLSDSLQYLQCVFVRYYGLEVDPPYYSIGYFRKRMGLLPPVSASGSEMQVGLGCGEGWQAWVFEHTA